MDLLNGMQSKGINGCSSCSGNVMKNIKSYVFCIISCLLLLPKTAFAQDCVILLHGLMRSSGSMSAIDSRLKQASYKTVNMNYASHRYSISDLADQTIPEAIRQCEASSELDRIHVITHSMGGLVIRDFLARNTAVKFDKVIMLGPPNQGSELIDFYARFPGFLKVAGPAAVQLSTSYQAERSYVVNDSEQKSYELIVIAGNKSINPILSWIIPGEDDGKVAVDRTYIDGVDHHIILPANHAMMMYNKIALDTMIKLLDTRL